MSVVETNKIDIIGIDKQTGQVVLTITDHLDWNSDNNHLLLLQEKINFYLSFIESGEIFQIYSHAKNRQALIKVYAMYTPDSNALFFLAEVKKIVEGAGFSFEFEKRA